MDKQHDYKETMIFGKVKKPFGRGASRRQTVFKWLIFLCGIFSGAYLNYYGFLFERIRVNLEVYDYSRRLVESKIFNVNGSNHYHIPNIIHFIWFGQNKTMSFVNYLSILSAHKIQQPDVILLHCDNLPSGDWWEKLWRQVPIKIVHRVPPTKIHGQRLLHKYHQGDIAKLEILMHYGGIYMDYDVIVLNSLNPLRKYEITMGKEKPPKLNAGIIIAHKDALYLRVIYQSYKDNYRPLDWDYNCARLPYQIYLKHPEMVHVEKYRLTTPDWTERHLLWKTVIDWSRLYIIHTMIHMNWADYTPENIRDMNTTFGEITRYIYYGSKKLLKR